MDWYGRSWTLRSVCPRARIRPRAERNLNRVSGPARGPRDAERGSGPLSGRGSRERSTHRSAVRSVGPTSQEHAATPPTHEAATGRQLSLPTVPPPRTEWAAASSFTETGSSWRAGIREWSANAHADAASVLCRRHARAKVSSAGDTPGTNVSSTGDTHRPPCPLQEATGRRDSVLYRRHAHRFSPAPATGGRSRYPSDDRVALISAHRNEKQRISLIGEVESDTPLTTRRGAATQSSHAGSWRQVPVDLDAPEPRRGRTSNGSE